MLETIKYQKGKSIEGELLKLKIFIEYFINNNNQQTKENVERLKKIIENNVWRSWEPFYEGQCDLVPSKFYIVSNIVQIL